MFDLRKYAVAFAVMAFLMAGTSSEAASLALPLSHIGYDKDIMAVGPAAAVDLIFPKPYGQISPDSIVNLWVEPYEQLNAASTFSFFVNGQEVQKVTAADLKKQPLIKLSIPSDLSFSSQLTVGVRSNLFVTNDVNADNQMGKLFYQIGSQSHLFLNFTPVAATTPDKFLQSIYQGLVVVISDQPSLAEINAGVWMMGIMHKIFPFQSVQLIYANQVLQYRDVPKLWIMTNAKLPSELAPFAGQVAVAGKDLVVAAQDGESLKNSVKQLASLAVLQNLATVNQAAVAAAAAQSGSATVAAGVSSWGEFLDTTGESGDFIVDDQQSVDIVDSAVELVYFMNRHLPEGKFVFPEFKNIYQYREVQSANYLVYIGLLENLPIDLQEDLPLWRGKNYLLQRNSQESLRYSYQPGSEEVIGQLGCYEGISTMIITAGQRRADVTLALQSLNQSDSQNRLGGDLFIYRTDHSLTTFDSYYQGSVTEVIDPTLPAWRKTVNKLMPRLIKLQHYGQNYGHKYEIYILLAFFLGMAWIAIKLILFIYADRSSFHYRGRHLPK